MLRRLFLSSLLALGCTAPFAQADPALAPPDGRVILTVSGNITRTNADGVAHFDRAMLEAVGMTEFETHTPFTEGVSTFRGVLMRDLMAFLGSEGTMVEAAALDRYTIEIPTEDFDAFDVMLALEVDGERLRVRNHGPAWVVYPWSHHEELDRAIYHSRSIWQLVSLDIR